MTDTDKYYNGRLFDKVDLEGLQLVGRQFEDCTFNGCDFSEIAFDDIQFTKCTFSSCNLSMVKFRGISLDQVHFIDSKLVGADFAAAKDFLFGANFTNCRLDYSSFIKKKNKKSFFKNCSLIGADFTETDLTSSTFERCDLAAAVFVRSNLKAADFTTSFNFDIDPEKNQLRQAKFSAHGLAGLLTRHGLLVE